MVVPRMRFTRKRLFLLLAVVPAMALLVLLFDLVTLSPGEDPFNFWIEVASQSGEELGPQNCMIVFIKQTQWGIAGPCWSDISGPRNSVIEVVPYAGRVTMPKVWSFGIPFGPARASTVHYLVLAHGHKAAYSGEHIWDWEWERVLHPNPSPKSPIGEDGYLGATIRLVPLSSAKEQWMSTDSVIGWLQLDNGGTGILPDRKTADLVREFLEADREYPEENKEETQKSPDS